MSARLIVIRWRDIPAQVMARQGRTAHKIELSPRFAVAIDRAAMAIGFVGTDEYLEQWQRDTSACDDDLELAATTAAREYEERYTQDRLNQIVNNGGIDSTKADQ